MAAAAVAAWVLVTSLRPSLTGYHNKFDDEESKTVAVGRPRLDDHADESSPAFRAVCRAHFAIQGLPFVLDTSPSTMDEVLGIDVNAAPFDSRGGGGDVMSWQRQSDIVFERWVAALEEVAAGAASEGGAYGNDVELDPRRKQAVDVLSFVAVTLRDDDARALYLYKILPQMRRAAVVGANGKRGKSERDPARSCSAKAMGEGGDKDECKRAMLGWLKEICVENGMWQR